MNDTLDLRRPRMHVAMAACALCTLAGCAADGGARAPGAEPLAIYHESERIEKSIGYAQAVRAGGWLFVSGTIGRGATLDEQMKSAYERIAKTLRAHGADFDDVVRETVYTTDFEALQRSEATRKSFYGAHTPASTWVGITRLYVPAAMLEIEVTARLER